MKTRGWGCIYAEDTSIQMVKWTSVVLRKYNNA